VLAAKVHSHIVIDAAALELVGAAKVIRRA